MNQKFQTIIGFSLLTLLFIWFSKNMDEKAKEELQKKKEAQELVKTKEKEVEAKAKTVSAKPPVLSSVPQTDSTAQDTAQKDTAVVPQLIRKAITINTDHYTIELDNFGARINSIILKDLSNDKGEFPELIQVRDSGALTFKVESKDYSEALFAFSDTTLSNEVAVQDSLTIEMTHTNEFNQTIVRTFTFYKDKYEFKNKIHFANFHPERYVLYWKGGLKETEKLPEDAGIAGAFQNFYFSELVFNSDDVYREISEEKEKYNSEGRIEWAGLRRRYVAAFIDFERRAGAVIRSKPIMDNSKKDDDEAKPPHTYSISLTEEIDENTVEFNFRILPLKFQLLTSYDKDYENLIVSGYAWFFKADLWFPVLCGWVLALLNLLYSIIPNYGVAIIILTLLVKFATLPLVLKQTKSMKKMQEHKPALDAIRQKYKADPRKMQQETMAYYQKVGVNPFAQMAGCLPMFIQMPIFFSLYVVFARAMELRGAPFAGWITDLSQPDVITNAVSIPYIMPMGLSLLPVLMAASMYYQMKQSMTDPNMKGMVIIMPVMMLFTMGGMASGLLLYWTLSNVFSIVQYKFTKTTPTNGAQDVKVKPVKK